METRHLFFTLRMIWNHTMPADAAIHPYRRYNFGPEYTKSYMRQAVLEIGRELLKRSDLFPWWVRDLQRMADYLAARSSPRKFNP